MSLKIRAEKSSKIFRVFGPLGQALIYMGLRSVARDVRLTGPSKQQTICILCIYTEQMTHDLRGLFVRAIFTIKIFLAQKFPNKKFFL